jgi:hypothetical protein
MIEVNLIITEILFAIVYVIAFLIVREFIKSKDGQLRKIMITYFSIEVLMYLTSALYFILVYLKKDPLPLNSFRIIIIIPKVFVKIWLLWYLKFGRNSDKLVNS